jgi:hypothetical protein
MTDNDPAVGPGHHVNFDAPTILRKWPSLNGQRRIDSAGPTCCSTAPWMSASGSSWPSPVPCDTSMRYILHHSPRWWALYYLQKIVAELARRRDFL